MQELWRPVPRVQSYEAGDLGHIRHARTQALRKPSLNPDGFPKITVRIEGQSTTRAVAGMVLDAFTGIDYDPRFNSVIHLNNRRIDCRLENLARRPRWFAIEYHNQFDPHKLAALGPNTTKYRVLETGELFENIAEVAMKYGLLTKKIFLSAANRGEAVWPTGQRFVFDHW